MVSSIVRGIRVYLKRRKVVVEENKILSYESQVRAVTIDFYWEQIKQIRIDIDRQNRELVEQFKAGKIQIEVKSSREF